MILPLSRVWLNDEEVNLVSAVLTKEQRGFLRSWSVEMELAGYPAIDIVSLGDVEFRGETDYGSGVRGHAIVADIQQSAWPLVSLRGTGPLATSD